MTIFSIAWKDVKKIFRNIFTLVMMFAAPFLITGLMYFAFGNTGEESGRIEAVRLGIVNNDSGTPYGNGGKQLSDFFRSPDLSELIMYEGVDSTTAGKEKIQDRSLDILLAIPENFSAELNTGNPSVKMYTDPALSIQTELVSSLLREFVSMISGIETFTQASAQFAGQIAEQYVNAHHTDDGEEDNSGQIMSMLTMCAMTIFFLFFAASTTAQGLVTEREEGTFQRMSVSPNRFSVLLTGKFTGVFLTVTIQAVALLSGATLLFGIRWSSLINLILISIATIISASGFTIFLMSLVSNSRQVGAVSGGVLTIAGMLGGLFTVGVPDLPGFFNTVHRFVPHGWALSGYRALLLPEQAAYPVWLSAAVTSGFGIVFLFFGTVIVSRKLR